MRSQVPGLDDALAHFTAKLYVKKSYTSPPAADRVRAGVWAAP